MSSQLVSARQKVNSIDAAWQPGSGTGTQTYLGRQESGRAGVALTRCPWRPPTACSPCVHSAVQARGNNRSWSSTALPPERQCPLQQNRQHRRQLDVLCRCELILTRCSWHKASERDMKRLRHRSGSSCNAQPKGTVAAFLTLHGVEVVPLPGDAPPLARDIVRCSRDLLTFLSGGNAAYICRQKLLLETL